MMNNHLLKPGIPLCAGLLGAWLATILGLPAAALFGSTIVVSVLALCRGHMAVPASLKNLSFAIGGCSLGCGVSPDVLQQFGHWYISLAGLVVFLGITMAMSTWLLSRLYGFDQTTAFLSTSPGALSYALALAEHKHADVHTITILQGLRLLVITLGLPLILNMLDHGGQFSTARTAAPLSYLHSAVLIACVYLVGTVATRYKMPAAYIVLGLLISAGLHMGGLLAGKMPGSIMFVGFAVIGTVVGVRFSAFKVKEIAALLAAACAVIFVGLGISALGAALVAQFLSLPFGQVWVAFAPGGVEAMAAMALSMDYDPAFVATHHVFRLLFLMALLPLLLGRSKKT
jgi:membrane AbrB-like protein